MSSWGGGRVHFREKRTIPNNSNPIIPTQVQSQQPPPSIFQNPSRFVFNSKNVNDAVICTIALDEELYVDEWIKYNLALGFSHIYIYDNSDKYILKDKNSNNVTVFHLPGEQQMLTSRDIFTLQYKNKHKWVAHIDLDEFIVLKKHKSIMDFLNEYDNCDSIALNWLMFGTANEKYYKNEPVTKRFQYCSTKTNEHYKCISKLQSINLCVNSHRPLLKAGLNIYDTNRRILNDIYNPDGDCNIACIHHYWTKSEDEFSKKIRKRMPDETPARSLSLLEGVHLRDNNVFNSDAWDFYSKHVPS